MPTPAPDADLDRDGEAATALTDGLIAVQCAYYARQLGRRSGLDSHAMGTWRATFGAAGIAAAAGAAHHALPPHRLSGLRLAFWKLVGLATGAAGLLLLVAGILAAITSNWRRLWIGVALLKSVLLGIQTWRRDNFRYIIYDYGSSMTALLALQWWRSTPASPSIRWGILLSFLAAAIQQKGPRLHRRFDHNALYHLVQMMALHCFFHGAQRLRGQG